MRKPLNSHPCTVRAGTFLVLLHAAFLHGCTHVEVADTRRVQRELSEEREAAKVGLVKSLRASDEQIARDDELKENSKKEEARDDELLNDEDLESLPASALDWNDVLSGAVEHFEANPGVYIEDALLTPERLASMPETLRVRPDLARLAVSRAIENPVTYHDGVFGTVGGAKFFAATTARVADFDRLYRVIVRVLSEKFSCFMVAREKLAESMKFRCRDRRQVVVWRATGTNWIQFYARQYDAEGYEIKVVKRAIVRISPHPVL